MILANFMWEAHDMWEWKDSQTWTEFWEWLGKRALEVATEVGEPDIAEFGQSLIAWLSDMVSAYLVDDDDEDQKVPSKEEKKVFPINNLVLAEWSPSTPDEHWHGCTLALNHTGDCLVPMGMKRINIEKDST